MIDQNKGVNISLINSDNFDIDITLDLTLETEELIKR